VLVLLATKERQMDSFQLKNWRMKVGAMQSFPYFQAGGPPCQAPEAADLIGAQCPTILLCFDDEYG
jgi:hypothetical protein